MLAKNPRRRSGAYSVTNVVAPAYSPPVEKPCSSLSTTRTIGANTPIVAYAGSTPIRNVDAAIMISVVASTFCRPIRSPRRPNTIPPSGRAMYVAANTPRLNRIWTDGSAVGRNTRPIVTAR